MGITTDPAWVQAKAALAAGDVAEADRLIDVAVARWRSLQDYSVNWITSLLTFIGEELGEEAVEAALRRTGEEFVRPRRATDPAWDELPAEVRARAIVAAMVANFGTCEVTEDDEKFVLSFHCGSGGRLIDEGAYEGEHAYLTLQQRGPRTFDRDRLPVYCHQMGGLVNDNAAVLKPLVVLPAAASLEKGFHSGHQNLRTEGLPHIIIHAKIKSKKLILLLRFRCQHDNRNLGGFPDLPRHAIAVESRHHNVQDNQSDVRLLLKNIHCLQTVSRLQHLISGTNQKVVHQLAHSRFVIHNKNLLHRQYLPAVGRLYIY